MNLAIEALFGSAGVALDKYLRTLNWVYMFQNFAGLLSYLRYDNIYLEDPQIPFSDLNEIKNMPIHFGEFIIDFICSEYQESTENTNSSAGSGVDPQQNSNTQFGNSIFDGICSPTSAKQPMRLVLLTRFVSRSGK